MAAHTYRCLQVTSQRQQEGISGYSAHAAPPDGVEALRQTRITNCSASETLEQLSLRRKLSSQTTVYQSQSDQYGAEKKSCLFITAINSLPQSQIFHWVDVTWLPSHFSLNYLLSAGVTGGCRAPHRLPTPSDFVFQCWDQTQGLLHPKQVFARSLHPTPIAIHNQQAEILRSLGLYGGSRGEAPARGLPLQNHWTDFITSS